MRLAFSVAVAETPDILLVDEILAVGDLKFQKKCLDRMRKFQEKGATMIMVSHNPQQIEQYCNKGLVLDKGKVVYFGEVKQAIQKYSALLQ